MKRIIVCLFLLSAPCYGQFPPEIPVNPEIPQNPYQRRHGPFKPFYQFPSQGYPANYYFPQTRLQRDLQAQHHNFFMTQPQPQRNPPGPKVNPLPWDESTNPIPNLTNPIPNPNPYPYY